MLPDSNTGKRALPVGARVSFRIEVQRIKGESNGRERAIEVVNEDMKQAPIDPTFREFGQVSFWDGDRGHVVRPNGDTLSFLAKNIVTQGIEELRVGSWLQYGVRVNRYLWSDEKQNFYHRVYARDICVCLENSEGSGPDSQPILPVEYIEPGSIEAQFLAATELPLSQPPVSLLSPQNRTKTLRELIAAGVRPVSGTV